LRNEPLLAGFNSSANRQTWLLAQWTRRSWSKGHPLQGLTVLKQIPLFADLDPPDLEIVAQASRRLNYPKNNIVFYEGDAGDYLLVILKGRVKVTLLGEQGQETIITTLEAPAFLGEVALLEGAPRSATVVALTPIEVLQIARAPFLALMRNHPGIALKIMAQLAGALRRATEQIRTLSMFDVYGRVLRCLLVTAQQRGETTSTRMIIRPRPSITELASMSGCSRETVSRAIKTLLATGYVSEVDSGLAVEQRAIRQYLLPTLQNLAPKPDSPNQS
jgi:CRP/FNR family cyclic AMP-dependent transcriptional regulator